MNRVNRRTRRWVARGAAAATAAALLPACGATGQGGEAGGGEAARTAAPVTVGFMQCGQQRADFYGGALLPQFKARHPNVTLDVQAVECGTTYLDKMVALLVGGTPPDVWDTGQGAFAEYTKQNAALALDPYIARDRAIDFPDFEPASMYALDGKRHMLPYDTGVNVLYYNTELWQRAGLPNPRQQWAAKRWDWAAFLDAVTRLSVDEGSGRRYGLAYTGTAPWGIGPFLWQNGGDWADWAQNKQTVDRPPAVEALLFVADLAQKHRAMPTPATNAAERPTFANGRVAMEMNFSFARSTFMKMDGVRWDVAHLPTGKAGNAVHVARNGFAISRSSRQPDGAWQCLAFATGKEACTQATQAGTVHPPRKSIAGSDVFLKPAGVSADFRPFVEFRALRAVRRPAREAGRDQHPVRAHAPGGLRRREVRPGGGRSTWPRSCKPCSIRARASRTSRSEALLPRHAGGARVTAPGGPAPAPALHWLDVPPGRAGVDGAGALTALRLHHPRTDFVAAPPGQPAAGLLRLALPLPDHFSHFAEAGTHGAPDITAADGGLRLTYPFLATSEGPLAVRIEIELAPDQETEGIRLRARVHNGTPDVIPQVVFPQLLGLGAVDGADGTRLQLGRGQLRPLRDITMRPDDAHYLQTRLQRYIEYGYGRPHNMKWLDYGSARAGVTLFSRDPRYHSTALLVERPDRATETVDLRWVHYPHIAPGETWESGDFVLLPHAGDWYAGARAYQRFTSRTFPYNAPRRLREALGVRTMWAAVRGARPTFPLSEITASTCGNRRPGPGPGRIGAMALVAEERLPHLPRPQAGHRAGVWGRTRPLPGPGRAGLAVRQPQAAAGHRGDGPGVALPQRRRAAGAQQLDLRPRIRAPLRASLHGHPLHGPGVGPVPRLPRQRPRRVPRHPGEVRPRLDLLRPVQRLAPAGLQSPRGRPPR